MKTKVIEHYGNGSVTKTAKALDMSTQRIYGWSDELSKLEKDGIIAAAVRQGLKVPSWLIK